MVSNDQDFVQKSVKRQREKQFHLCLSGIISYQQWGFISNLPEAIWKHWTNLPLTHGKPLYMTEQHQLSVRNWKSVVQLLLREQLLSVNTEIQVEVSVWRRGARKKHDINIIQECVKLSRP